MGEAFKALLKSLLKPHLATSKISVLSSHLSLEEVIELARRYKVPYKDIRDEYDRFEASLYTMKLDIKAEPKANEIIEAVKNFRPEPIYDENDLEKQLYQYLKAKFPDLPVRRQVKLGEGLKIDLKVGPCGIELKVPKSRSHLQRLIGQVRDYSEYLNCVIAVVFDAGVVKDLNSFFEKLSSMGMFPIRIEGKLKQRPSRKVQKVAIKTKARPKRKSSRSKSRRRASRRKRS